MARFNRAWKVKKAQRGVSRNHKGRGNLEEKNHNGGDQKKKKVGKKRRDLRLITPSDETSKGGETTGDMVAKRMRELKMQRGCRDRP